MPSTTPGTSADAASVEHFALLRRLADDLAHELKNPLNAVVINLELLRTRVLSGRAEEALGRIDVVEAELRRLHTLLDQTLRLMRPDRGGNRFPVDEVLAEVGGIAGVLAKVSQRNFELEPVGEDVVVQLAREPLRLAVLLLVEGALRAAEEDGAPVRVHGAPAGERVMVHIDAPAAAGPALQAAAERLRRMLPDGGMVIDSAAGGCRQTLTLPRGT